MLSVNFSYGKLAELAARNRPALESSGALEAREDEVYIKICTRSHARAWNRARDALLNSLGSDPHGLLAQAPQANMHLQKAFVYSSGIPWSACSRNTGHYTRPTNAPPKKNKSDTSSLDVTRTRLQTAARLLLPVRRQAFLFLSFLGLGLPVVGLPVAATNQVFLL